MGSRGDNNDRRRRLARARGRAGITLTEILIAILILGVGLVSVATLFPIGLLRLRDAARYSRSAYLAQSAGADMSSRNLAFEPFVHEQPVLCVRHVRPL